MPDMTQDTLDLHSLTINSMPDFVALVKSGESIQVENCCEYFSRQACKLYEHLGLCTQ